ncbi:hypothetical protein [Cupriavidus basilensis]|uniref:hypothetical protein n=1 Tax=Cupriavidus basilensis TaxID=68895 RepID=UPI0020A622FC|nr:hypothetical protein [Cupriavidus basilensis]MCP3020381.1 hypothetical protein [Cupriavidus basilensis]
MPLISRVPAPMPMPPSKPVFDAYCQLAPVHFAQIEVAFWPVEVVGLAQGLEFDLVFEQAADPFVVRQPGKNQGESPKDFRHARTRHANGTVGS